jgi:4-hydroxybenzoyl-CoA reductase subunit beta
MSLPAFELLRPRTLEAAMDALSHHGADLQMVAGGTDLVPSMRQGLFAPKLLLDLKGLRELDFIRFDAEQGLEIGALATITGLANSELIRRYFPVLEAAALHVASPPLRNMGTLGGNLCLDTRCLYYNQSDFWRGSLGGCIKKDGAVCHVAPGSDVCWAAFSGDLAPALLALDATIELASPRGVRTLPLTDLYLNDGLVRLNKARDEMVTTVRVPASSAGWSGTYKKLRIRGSIDYPLAGVAVTMCKGPDGACLDARVALTAVNPMPRLVPAAAALIGKTFDPALVEEIAYQAIRTGKPLRTSASTMEYRRHMVRVFVRRAVTELWQNGRAVESVRPQ